MALVAPTITATLPAAVIAEVAADVVTDDFIAGKVEGQYKVPCEERKLRGNRTFDLKQAANDALTKAGKPTRQADTNYVLRCRTKLVGKTLTVTLYWGREVRKDA